MITIRQLQYALAVAQTLHFKKASELCSVSQSALSTAITELERQLGVQIFERDNKKVMITPLGQQVLDRARRIFLQVEDLYQFGNAQQQPLSYPMTMGVIPTIGPYLLPKVLPAVRRDYPDFALRIEEEQSHVLVDRVRQGDIDTAILALPYALDGLLAFEFWAEDFLWVVHSGDPLAREDAVSSEQLRNASLMLLKDGHCLKEHALAACHLGRESLDNSFASTSLHTLVQMAAGRLGSTLVPRLALDQLLSGTPELRAVPLQEPGPHRRLAFIVRPNYAGVRSIELLVKIFNNELQT